MHVLTTSRPYLFIALDGPDTAGDLTSYVAEIALIPDDGTEPEETDWHVATWIGGQAALLIGPGGDVQYPRGEFMAFVRISAGSERPVLTSGRVRVGLG